MRILCSRDLALCVIEVIKDHKGFLPAQLSPDDLEELMVEERVQVEAAHARQASCIRRYLAGEDGPGLSQKKVFRSATYKLLQAVEHALVVVTGCGLERFASGGTKLGVVSEVHQEQLKQWEASPLRCCVFAADQLSCGPCGMAFLHSPDFQLLTDLLADPPHRFWNHHYSIDLNDKI